MLTKREQSELDKVYERLDAVVAKRVNRFVSQWIRKHPNKSLNIIFAMGTEIITIDEEDCFLYHTGEHGQLLEEFMDDIWEITKNYTLTAPYDIAYYKPLR